MTETAAAPAPAAVADAVARFLADTAVGRSAETVKTYRAALNRFADFLATLAPPPLTVAELTADHPIDFVRWRMNWFSGKSLGSLQAAAAPRASRPRRRPRRFRSSS